VIAILLCLAAAGVFFLPAIKQAGKTAATATAKQSSPSYQAAIANLALVRLRLNLTETLTDPEKKAIDALTLALVAGSDKE
jgi:hypothetical protein